MLTIFYKLIYVKKKLNSNQIDCATINVDIKKIMITPNKINLCKSSVIISVNRFKFLFL